MIDSHCHLDHEPLFENLTDIINRSKETGVTKLLTICTTHKSFEKIIKIINKDVMIYGTFGIHPHETKNNKIDKQTIIKKVEDHNKIIGIGETGLDFFYNHSDKDMQIKSFKEHIEASIALRKPIIIHSRNAENETFDILNNYKHKNLKILMHCFTGSKDFSIRVIDPGILVSGWRSYLCMFASICDFTLYQMSPSGAHFLGSLSSYMKLSTPTALTSFPMTADIIVDPLYTPISK